MNGALRIAFSIGFGSFAAGLLSVSMFAQNGRPAASTNGTCSPIVYGNRNVIDCGKLSPQDAAALAEILNEARSSSKSLSEIKDLLQSALNPYRAVVTYGPDGQRMAVNSAGGVTTEISDGESAAYEQFLDFNKQHRWPEMISLAEAERRKAPGWYTADFFEGVAYGGLCDVHKSKEYADKFVSEVAEIPQYERLLKFAKDAQSKLAAEISSPGSFPCGPRPAHQ